MSSREAFALWIKSTTELQRIHQGHDIGLQFCLYERMALYILESAAWAGAAVCSAKRKCEFVLH